MAEAPLDALTRARACAAPTAVVARQSAAMHCHHCHHHSFITHQPRICTYIARSLLTCVICSDLVAAVLFVNVQPVMLEASVAPYTATAPAASAPLFRKVELHTQQGPHDTARTAFRFNVVQCLHGSGLGARAEDAAQT